MVVEAAAELDRVPTSDRTALEVVAVRLAVLQEQHDWPALRDLAADFVRRAPDQAAGWVTWAYATRRAASLELAEEILRQAEQRHPKEATIQFKLGCYACQRGDLAGARRRVDRAIALNSNFTRAATTDPDLAPLRAAAPRRKST